MDNQVVNGKKIKSISVLGLFGLYNYNLPKDGLFNNISILYGNNGAGKSTILKLVFHLLSNNSPSNSHHLKELNKIRFNEIVIYLDGAVVKAKKIMEKNTLQLTIEANKKSISYEYFDRDLRRSEFFESEFIEINLDDIELIESKRSISGHKKNFKNRSDYYHLVRDYLPEVFSLNAERRLDGNSIADIEDETELRGRVTRREGRVGIYGLVNRSREIALAQALSSAHKWISKKVVEGNNIGAENVHTIYINISKQLSGSEKNDSDLDAKDTQSKLLEKLANIERKSSNLSKYELATNLDINDLKLVLLDSSKGYYKISVDLLGPYIDSLDSRLSALTPIYDIVDKFIFIINQMLSDKSMNYNIKTGFSIKNTLGDSLEPIHLSSGEQQLILLFLYVLIARDSRCLFMIDEPEISLNIKWQRNVIQYLNDITEGENTQFIFASHSMEIIAQHIDNVITLEFDHD